MQLGRCVTYYNGVYILVYTKRSEAVRSEAVRSWTGDVRQRNLGQLVHLIANTDDLAMTTIRILTAER